jgi:predicted anti-sigma-YlaC factor YlaD
MWREALSAGADGEPLGVEESLLQAHLRRCVECAAFEAGMRRVHRATRLHASEPVPDLTAAILDQWAADRPQPGRPAVVLRWVLVLVAALEMGLAAPELLGPWHAVGELGTWEAASAVGFLSVAARPRWAAQMLPMLSVATLLTVMVIAHDFALGTVAISQEWPHALLVAGVTALAAIARLNRSSTPPDPRRTAWVGGGTGHRAHLHRAA